MTNYIKHQLRYILHRTLNLYGEYIISKRKHFTPKIIIHIDGGLGSQMWQYALGYCASRLSGLAVEYDTSWFKKYGKDINRNFNRNLNFPHIFTNIVFNEATTKDAEFYRKYFYYYSNYYCKYVPEFLSSKKPRYLGLYYTNYRYIDNFRYELKNMLQLDVSLLTGNNIEILSTIKNAKIPIAVHVRRGDFVKSAHDVTTPVYFNKAIQFLQNKFGTQRATFFIFTNDYDFTKKIFNNFQGNFYYVNGNDNDHEANDMILMGQCRHFVISNSNFSWWPAYLATNSDKLVIAPDHWFNKNAPLSMRKYNETAWICDGWITLPTE